MCQKLPDYIFRSHSNFANVVDDGDDDDNEDVIIHPPVFAPHFLTSQFTKGQQELLTAASLINSNNIIPSSNSVVEVSGIWTLSEKDDVAISNKIDTRFVPRDHPRYFLIMLVMHGVICSLIVTTMVMMIMQRK